MVSKLFHALLVALIATLPTAGQSVTVTSSNLLNQREGFGRDTFGGLNGTLYVVSDKRDYDTTKNEPVIPNTLRYVLEEIEGPRWIVFSPSLFNQSLTDGRIIARFNLKRRLRITDGDVTIDGRAGQDSQGRPRVVALTRQYNWSNHVVTENGQSCDVKKNANGEPLEHDSGILEIANTSNVIISHLIFRQYRSGSPSQPVLYQSCFGDQISVFNNYPKDENDKENPTLLSHLNSYDAIWINRSQFYICGDECIGITRPSANRNAYISITGNEFYQSSKSILIGANSLYWINNANHFDTDWRLYITVSGNHFYRGHLRMPRFNSGYFHFYNNLFEAWGDRAIDPREFTRSFIEQNLFRTWLSGGGIEYQSIDTDFQNDDDEFAWADRNHYNGTAVNRDADFPNVPTSNYPYYYDEDALGEMIDFYSLSWSVARSTFSQITGWVSEPNDVYAPLSS